MWKPANGRHEDFLKKAKGQSISIVKPNPTRDVHHYLFLLGARFLVIRFRIKNSNAVSIITV